MVRTSSTVDKNASGDSDLETNLSIDWSFRFGSGPYADNRIIGTLDLTFFILAATTAPFMSGI